MGKYVNKYIININFFQYSISKNKTLNIEDNFIEYYNKNFNYEKIPKDLDFDLKFYAMIFESYIEYLKNPDIKIFSFWKKKLKPFLIKNFPINKKGIFTTNADIDLLIKKLDKYFNNFHFDKEILNEIKIKLNEKNENKINLGNQPIKKEVLEIKNDLREHSSTIASISTSDSYNIENNINNNIEKKVINKSSINKHINNMNNNKNSINNLDNNKKCLNEYNTPKINNNNFKNNINDNEEDKKDEENIINENLNIGDYINENNNIINNNSFFKSRTQIVFKGITATFIDNDEIESKNIVHSLNQKNKIIYIDFNLLLKKIVENDFRNNNSELLYSFIRQSFSFIKKEIFIKKTINCYNNYKKNNNFSNGKDSLIFFLNAYIIEMFLYYKSVINDVQLIKILSSFYNDLITEKINSINLNYSIISKNDILNEKFFIENIKINKDSTINEEKNYSEKYIRNKLYNRIEKNRSKLNEINTKNKFNIRQSYNFKIEDINKIISLHPMQKNNDDKNEINSHYSQNSLNLDNIFHENKKIKKKKKNIKINEDIENKNRMTINYSFNNDIINNSSIEIKNKIPINEINDSYTEINNEKQKKLESKINNKKEKNRNNSYRDDKKKIEKFEFDEITNYELIEIIGNNYKNIINNSNLMTKEENFLQNLKGIIFLINLNEYKESYILSAKEHEQFYENFSFYKGKDLDNIFQINKKNNINKKNLAKSKNYKEFILNAQLNIFQGKPKKCFSVLDWEPAQIGEELIKISIDSLNKIEYKELYGAIFSKEQKEINCPNIMENIKKFNDLIFFIVEDILSYDFPKDRAKMIEKWLQIAKYCKSRKDQSNCFAINSALNHYIITGLNLTLKELKSKTKIIMNEIKEYCTLEGNYKVFREEIKNIKNGEFFVPYLGALLRDLTFFEEKGKYLVKNNLINLEKIEKVQNAIDSFFKYKNSVNPVKYEKIYELGFFENLENLTESELEEIANKLEPEFKVREIQGKEKRYTMIDSKYFLNEMKRGSCIFTKHSLNLK